MCPVSVLQNGVDVVEGETGSYSETGVTCDVDGTEEVSIKVEDPTDIRDEIPEAITFPPIKTELEVRLWGGGGERWRQLVLSGHLLSKKEIVR